MQVLKPIFTHPGKLCNSVKLMLFAECWMQEYCAIICAWMAEHSKMIHLQMIKQPQGCGCDAQTVSLQNGNSLS
jgi:hypothetical protein